MCSLRSSLLIGWALCVCACSVESPAPFTRAEIVYGHDDRLEVFEHPDVELRRIAAQSIVAIMSPEKITVSGASVSLQGSPLGVDRALCPGERFAEQPTAAECSGTLIDNDLVLTAGHCFDDDGPCSETRFVFGYYYDRPGELHAIHTDDVYACRRVVVRQLIVTDSEVLDYAVAQLDRPVSTGHVPATVSTRTGAIANGDGVAVVGFGSGLPGKIDNGATVVNTRERVLDFFQATLDSFGGNSGSGVFDDSHEVVGILVRGGEDYQSVGSCNVVNVVSEDTPVAESVSYVARPIAALCDMGWPSPRLCATATTCGDGYCTGDETATSCAADCDENRCGDEVCSVGEDATSCPDDCSGPDPQVVPPDWTCPPGFWSSLDGCDCECGPRDPDCDVVGQIVARCAENEVCNAASECVPGVGGMAGVPVSWSCPSSFYNDSDGCDCECGAVDPDCSDANQTLFNCNADAVCGSTGHCEIPEAVPAPAPATCAIALPGSGRGNGAARAVLLVLVALAGIRRRHETRR
ncbi:MAG: trypsin-like peptidase domain-containing protein [Sandaracinaceae bacterium]|nr:trypsin-like peptidase domain-containing protein [Sandaracinaceae bacterium]